MVAGVGVMWTSRHVRDWNVDAIVCTAIRPSIAGDVWCADDQTEL